MSAGSKGLSAHLLAFLRSAVFTRLGGIEDILHGTAFTDNVHRQRDVSLWGQVNENRAILALLKSRVPELLAEHPEIERSFAHRDVFMVDLAGVAEVHNPWILSEPEGWPRPWPGAEEAPALR